MFVDLNNRGRFELFLDDLIAVYQKHRLTLGHEDHGGAFIIEPYSERNVDWLREAQHSIEFLPGPPVEPYP